jgi:hypothetical protein
MQVGHLQWGDLEDTQRDKLLQAIRETCTSASRCSHDVSRSQAKEGGGIGYLPFFHVWRQPPSVMQLGSSSLCNSGSSSIWAGDCPTAGPGSCFHDLQLLALAVGPAVTTVHSFQTNLQSSESGCDCQILTSILTGSLLWSPRMDGQQGGAAVSLLLSLPSPPVSICINMWCARSVYLLKNAC